MNLFVYGTLMFPQVMQAVCGYRGPGQAALLEGYRRRMLGDEVYPGIFPCAGDTVSGLVYPGLSPSQLHRLDRFEGETYERHTVRVAVGGRELGVLTYVMSPAWRHLLSDQAWDPGDFERQALAGFLSHYPGFRDRDGNPM